MTSVLPSLRAANPSGRRGIGQTGREERSPYGRLIFLPACTDAETLELSRAPSCRNHFERFPFGASYWRAASSRWEVMRLRDLTHGFLVSFAEPGAIAPVLIPLST